jgi:hypothetical protein
MRGVVEPPSGSQVRTTLPLFGVVAIVIVASPVKGVSGTVMQIVCEPEGPQLVVGAAAAGRNGTSTAVTTRHESTEAVAPKRRMPLTDVLVCRP